MRSAGHAVEMQLTAVGFEPTQLALVELESTPLDHSGKLSLMCAEGVGTFIADIGVQHSPPGCETTPGKLQGAASFRVCVWSSHMMQVHAYIHQCSRCVMQLRVKL